MKKLATHSNVLIGLILLGIFISTCTRLCGASQRLTIRDRMVLLIRDIVKDPAQEQFFLAMAQTESNLDPNAKGLLGEVGLFQIRLSTVYDSKYKISFSCVKKYSDISKALWKPEVNTRCAMEYYNKLLKLFPSHSMEEIVYAYNVGPWKAKLIPYYCSPHVKYKKGSPCVHIQRFMDNYFKRY